MTQAADARLTDELRRAKALALAKSQERELRLRRVLNGAFGTEDGRAALRVLFEMCGYDKVDVVGTQNASDLSEKASWHNMARRGVYVELRRYIRRETLIAVEFKQDDEDVLSGL